MAKGSHFTREDLLALREPPHGDKHSRWGQRICNKFQMTNPRLYYGSDVETARWIEEACRDYQL